MVTKFYCEQFKKNKFHNGAMSSEYIERGKWQWNTCIERVIERNRAFGR